jgi:formylglycine-generating enzyme required for sulfatase activity
MNGVYLPAFVKLYNHYKETEETEKMNTIRKYIIDISKKSGQETEVSELLGVENSTPNSFNALLMNTKKVERNFVKLKQYDNLFVNKFEVSNREYNKFLNEILYSELYPKCLYDSTKWNAIEIEYTFNQPMVNMYHSHPAYNDYPVVNISHFAATKYCEWLTQQYNTQRKRKYTQVIFRLPTEKEWEYAARGDDSSKKSPFDNDVILNKECEGCYYANLKYSKQNAVKYSVDGGFYTVKTQSYNPNKIGAYNVIGNVAEMINIQNISKGGSWNNSFKESNINLKATYSEPNAETGFRVIMEVIQE